MGPFIRTLRDIASQKVNCWNFFFVSLKKIVEHPLQRLVLNMYFSLERKIIWCIGFSNFASVTNNYYHPGSSSLAYACMWFKTFLGHFWNYNFFLEKLLLSKNKNLDGLLSLTKGIIHRWFSIRSHVNLRLIIPNK